MEWTSENLKWFFDQSPPRQVDETLLAAALVDPNKTRSIFILDFILKPWLKKEAF
jgi:hypothetical protein